MGDCVHNFHWTRKSISYLSLRGSKDVLLRLYFAKAHFVDVGMCIMISFVFDSFLELTREWRDHNNPQFLLTSLSCILVVNISKYLWSILAVHVYIYIYITLIIYIYIHIYNHIQSVHGYSTYIYIYIYIDYTNSITWNEVMSYGAHTNHHFSGVAARLLWFAQNYVSIQYMCISNIRIHVYHHRHS